MWKLIFGGVVVLAIGFVVFVAARPAEFEVTRSIRIAAAPETVFARVNDLHQWNAWSPWAKIDPHAKNSFHGPDAGAGSSFSWSGNKDIGEGKMTVVESRPNELVKIRLEFYRPFRAVHMAEFVFQPEAGGTAATWTMRGKNTFLSKCIGLFMSSDQMLGGFFETGLVQLKAVSETALPGAAPR